MNKIHAATHVYILGCDILDFRWQSTLNTDLVFGRKYSYTCNTQSSTA